MEKKLSGFLKSQSESYRFLSVFLKANFSPIEIMEIMTMPDELLLPVLAPIHRGFEVPDLRALACGAERAECGIDIVCFLPHRAIVNPVNVLDHVASGKRGADRVARFVLHKHAETGNQEFQEPEPDVIAFTSTTAAALRRNHRPVRVNLLWHGLVHGSKSALLVHQSQGLPGAEQVFGDLFLEPVPVFGGYIADLFFKIAPHLLDVFGGIPEHDR